MLLLVMASLLLPGCEMPPPEGSTPPQSYQPDQTITPPDDSEVVLGALIHRIDMPLDVSLDECWAQVDEQAVPVLMHGMWQVNGLRIGILHAQDAVKFAEALPTINGESRAKLFSSHYPTAVRSTPRLREPVNVDLTVPPRSPTLYRARDGKLQLLVRIGRSENGQVFVEVTPHHYKPKPDLIPRNPLEKQLDGRVFRELSALLPVSEDTAIVIGLYRPWPEPPTETVEEETTEILEPQTPDDSDTSTEVVTEDIEVTTEASTEKAVEPTAPPIPDGLGRSLMTGTRAGQPIQIMMVISMLEESTASPGNASDAN